MLVLNSIGVFGVPPSPKSEWEELLKADGDPAFLSSSVQPVTLRRLAAILLQVLPPADRAFVGLLLRSSGLKAQPAERDSDAAFSHTVNESFELNRHPSLALDSCPPGPLFFIQLGASQRSIVRDVQDQVKRWKARRKGRSSTGQIAKIPQYLEVWNLHEGWANGEYDYERGLTFEAIAQRHKKAISTIHSQFQSAFEFITGHPFKPELWFRLFGPLKYSAAVGGAKKVFMTRHRFQSPVTRDVPEAVLNPASDAGLLDTVEDKLPDKTADTDFVTDMTRLLARGACDEEIIQTLNLSDEGATMIPYVRKDWEELQKVLQ